MRFKSRRTRNSMFQNESLGQEAVRWRRLFRNVRRISSTWNEGTWLSCVWEDRVLDIRKDHISKVFSCVSLVYCFRIERTDAFMSKFQKLGSILIRLIISRRTSNYYIFGIRDLLWSKWHLPRKEIPNQENEQTKKTRRKTLQEEVWTKPTKSYEEAQQL